MNKCHHSEHFTNTEPTFSHPTGSPGANLCGAGSESAGSGPPLAARSLCGCSSASPARRGGGRGLPHSVQEKILHKCPRTILSSARMRSQSCPSCKERQSRSDQPSSITGRKHRTEGHLSKSHHARPTSVHSPLHLSRLLASSPLYLPNTSSLSWHYSQPIDSMAHSSLH